MLEQAVAEGAFAVVDMGDDAEVAVAVEGDHSDALLELGGAAHLGAIFGVAGGACAAELLATRVWRDRSEW